MSDTYTHTIIPTPGAPINEMSELTDDDRAAIAEALAPKYARGPIESAQDHQLTHDLAGQGLVMQRAEALYGGYDENTPRRSLVDYCRKAVLEAMGDKITDDAAGVVSSPNGLHPEHHSPGDLEPDGSHPGPGKDAGAEGGSEAQEERSRGEEGHDRRSDRRRRGDRSRRKPRD